MDPLVLIAILLALVIGLAAGWWFGSRGVASIQAGAAAREAEFKAAIADLGNARIEIARLESDARNFDARMREFRELQDQTRAAMQGQFAELATKALGEAQQSFLARAQDRFAEEGKSNEAKLKALLSPVETTLKRYEENLQRVEKERDDSYGALKETVSAVRAELGQTRQETAKLVNVLRASPKARGRWGEQSLRNVLEAAGLSEYARDFATEVSVDGAEGRLRPDVVVRLPGGRELVIDAKCSLNAFLDASDAVDEASRAAALKAHAAAIRNHAQQLRSKAYWTEFAAAADYVIMYIPGEQFLFAALEQDPELWEWAHDKRVLLATPTNLVAIARTVANIWRQENLIEDARKVDALGKELHERLSVAAGHLKRVGSGLNSAVDNYNKFVASFDGRVLVTARRFRDLSVDTGGREIEELEPVDAIARASVAELPSPEEADRAEAELSS